MKVLLVDDSLLFIRAIEDYLRLVRSPSFEIVGRARNGHDAIRSVAELKPDLVLLDLVMPGTNGLEVARQIKALPDAPRVIVRTSPCRNIGRLPRIHRLTVLSASRNLPSG